MQIRTILLIVLLALLAGIISPIFAQSSGLPNLHAKFSLEGGFGRSFDNLNANVVSFSPYVTVFTKDSNPRWLLDIGGKAKYLHSGEDKYGRTESADIYELFMNVNWRPFSNTFLNRLTLYAGGGIEYSDVTYSVVDHEDVFVEGRDFSKTSLVWNAGGKFALGQGKGKSEWYLVFNASRSDQLQSFGSCEYAFRGTAGIGVRFG